MVELRMEAYMARKRKYKKYDPEVKAMVSMTARPDLFPEMNIPKMTALYWINQVYPRRTLPRRSESPRQTFVIWRKSVRA